MKNIFKKTLRFISSRLLYLVVGIFLAIGATYVYATWDQAKTGGSGQLSEANWNELVNMAQSDLSAINTKLNNTPPSTPYINWNDCESKYETRTQTDSVQICCSSGYTLVTTVCSVSGTDANGHRGLCRLSSTNCLYIGGDYYAYEYGSIKCCKYVTP